MKIVVLDKYFYARAAPIGNPATSVMIRWLRGVCYALSVASGSRQTTYAASNRDYYAKRALIVLMARKMTRFRFNNIRVRFRCALLGSILAVSAMPVRAGADVLSARKAPENANSAVGAGRNNNQEHCCPAGDAHPSVTIPPGGGGSNGQASTDETPVSGNTPVVLVKPGQSHFSRDATEDIVATDNIDLARQQAVAYPNSPEASFILAVALTRTSQVEEALKEVRRARRLAQDQGGAAYFNKMISTYENMLTYCPADNHVRYMLAWLLHEGLSTFQECAGSPGGSREYRGQKVNSDMASQMLTMLSPDLAKGLPGQNGKTFNQ